MLDSYLFEMEKEKINYIMEHKDQSAQNLNEFFLLNILMKKILKFITRTF